MSEPRVLRRIHACEPTAQDRDGPPPGIERSLVRPRVRAAREPADHSQSCPDEIGRELDVHYILEGSVRRAGDRIRITAQLIQVSDQTHLWAEQYDNRALEDVFDVQGGVDQGAEF